MDPAHRITDELLKKLEKRITREYSQAAKEVQNKLDDYLRRFRIKDETWRSWVKDGTRTKEEYQKWRTGQIMMSQRWEEMRDSIAEDLHNTNLIARNMTHESLADVYALNHNYGTFEVEKGSQLDTSYTLYDRDTVERLIRDNPNLLPEPGKKTAERIRKGLDVRWNREQIQSVMTQSILQGESIPQIATRLAHAVGDANRKTAIRNARTMTTEAENAARVNSYKRAEDMGIRLKQQWMATLDKRTRHKHRILDGQIVPVGEPFDAEGIKIRYPGDPEAPPEMVYNCRCTLVAAIDGYEQDLSQTDARHNKNLAGMTYEEWLEGKEEPQPILKPDITAEIMREAYVSEYRGER